MIKDFLDGATFNLFNGVNSKAARRILPPRLHPVARRKLHMLNAVVSLEDLASPPSNRLEKLRGDLAGLYSIRINEQYRIIFAFDEGANASAVRISDYH